VRDVPRKAWNFYRNDRFHTNHIQKKFLVVGTWPPNEGSQPQLVGALARDPRGARNGEGISAICVAVAEKIVILIFFQRHLAATPSIAATPFRVHRVPTPRPISRENFASLGPRVQTLFDFFEISKCPTTGMHEVYTRAHWQKHWRRSRKKNSSTLGVVGVERGQSGGPEVVISNVYRWSGRL